MTIEIIDLVVRSLLILATAFLFGIVFAACLRVKNRKLLLISAGFLIFFIHALVTIPELIYGFSIDENIHLLIHLVALTFILVGILKD